MYNVSMNECNGGGLKYKIQAANIVSWLEHT